MTLDEPVTAAETAATPEAASDHAGPPEPADARNREAPQVIDLVADELSLARGQLDAGQPGLAEGTVRRRLAWLEAEGVGVDDESDALRTLLAEALWRQGRPLAARQALDAVRVGSPQRRLPIATLIEAEALAATGEPDRAAGAMERVLTAVVVDAAFELRGGGPGRLAWPMPAELGVPARPDAPAPWRGRRQPAEDAEAEGIDDERIAAGRARMEGARVAYVRGDRAAGDAEMSLAVRLDPSLAADGVAVLEPTLGGQPEPERLLLYGDLLRAAGRAAEATAAYDRAAGRGV